MVLRISQQLINISTQIVQIHKITNISRVIKFMLRVLNNRGHIDTSHRFVFILSILHPALRSIDIIIRWTPIIVHFLLLFSIFIVRVPWFGFKLGVPFLRDIWLWKYFVLDGRSIWWEIVLISISVVFKILDLKLSIWVRWFACLGFPKCYLLTSLLRGNISFCFDYLSSVAIYCFSLYPFFPLYPIILIVPWKILFISVWRVIFYCLCNILLGRPRGLTHRGSLLSLLDIFISLTKLRPEVKVSRVGCRASLIIILVIFGLRSFDIGENIPAWCEWIIHKI